MIYTVFFSSKIFFSFWIKKKKTHCAVSAFGGWTSFFKEIVRAKEVTALSVRWNQFEHEVMQHCARCAYVRQRREEGAFMKGLKEVELIWAWVKRWCVCTNIYAASFCDDGWQLYLFQYILMLFFSVHTILIYCNKSAYFHAISRNCTKKKILFSVSQSVGVVWGMPFPSEISLQILKKFNIWRVELLILFDKTLQISNN